MVLLGSVKKFWILEYLCHFIIRLHIKGRLLVKPLAIAHFSIQEYEFGVWYFSREFGCIVVRFARLKNSSILFLVCTLQTENVVIIPILFQTNGLFVLQLLILFFSIFAKKIEVKAYRLQHFCCHGNNGCFHTKTSQKKSEMFISLSQAKYNVTN